MAHQTKSNLHPRRQLLALEQKLFRENEALIRESVEGVEPRLLRYQKNYEKSVAHYQRKATMDEVLRDMVSSDFVLFGDFHTLDQSQRSFVRFLKHHLQHHDKPIVVALEAVQARYQKHLQHYMADQISQEQFVKRIGFRKHWFFDLWDGYEIIFDFLKYHRIPVFGVEANMDQRPDLQTRDAFISEQLVKIKQDHPDHTVITLVGDWHLAEPHLPKSLQQQRPRGQKPWVITSLFQNSPRIYWHLSEKLMVDHTLIVKMKNRQYCRLHTPPLIVQQSYMNWLYHEDGRFDWVDAKGSFLGLLERQAKVLGLKVPAHADQIDVYTCGDLGFLKSIRRQKNSLTKDERNFVMQQMARGESCVLPQAGVVYIANVSIHHAAEEASHYLKFLFSGPEFPRSHRDAFYANLWHEALGFFGSKLINSKRKAPHPQEMRVQQRYFEQAELTRLREVEYETALMFMEQMRWAGRGKVMPHGRFSGLSQELFLSVTHALGYDLGDRLYFGFMDGTIKAQEFRAWFCDPFNGEGEAGQEYLRVFKRLKTVKRSFAM